MSQKNRLRQVDTPIEFFIGRVFNCEYIDKALVLPRLPDCLKDSHTPFLKQPIPRHFIQPTKAQGGRNIKSKQWFSKPKSRNSHALGNAAAWFELMLAMIDFHARGFVCTEDDLHKRIHNLYASMMIVNKNPVPKRRKTGYFKKQKFDGHLENLLAKRLHTFAKDNWQAYEKECSNLRYAPIPIE